MKAGRLKALAVTSDRRTAALPDVPTMAEAGVNDSRSIPGRPPPRPRAARRGQGEARSRIGSFGQSPDIKAKFEAVGFDVVASNGEQFAEFLADEIARWKTVIETGKITAE